MTTTQPIQFGDEGQRASRELMRRFERLCARRPGLAEATLDRNLRTLEAIDRQYGGATELALEDAPDLVAATLTELAHLANELAGDVDVADLTVGVALWAIRHGVPIDVPEPVVNALAARSNRARGKQELSAVFGLMQGLAEHVRPRLGADLERSNPERAWRVLHANLAITGIRTEDPALIDYAFDALDAALPEERSSFYSEALALALAPGIAPAVRERIEARHLKWTPGGNS